MNIDLKAPKGWGELSCEDFLRVMEVGTMQLTREERLLVLLCHFTGIRRRNGNRYVTADGRPFTMQPWQLADFCDRLAWMLDEKPDRVPNPTKRDEWIRDMSFGDWFETDTQLRLLVADRDPSHWSVIGPKLGIDGTPSEAVEAMVMLWWNQVSDALAQTYPNVFPDNEGDEKRDYDPFKAIQNMHLLLNDDRPQDNKAIDDANVHDVLSALDSKIEKIRRENAAMRRIKP